MRNITILCIVKLRGEISLQIKDTLHPLFETMGLVYQQYHHEELRKDEMAYLEGLGLDSAAFFQNYAAAVDGYREAFSARYQPHAEERFLFESFDQSLVLFLVMLFLEHPDWETTLAQKSDEELRREICALLVRDLEQNIPVLQSLDQYMDFMESLPLEETLKWKFLSVLYQPVHWLGVFLAVYQKNFPAWQAAAHQYEKEIGALLRCCTNLKQSCFSKLVAEFADDTAVYFTVANPLIEWVGFSASFYGVLNQQVEACQAQRVQGKEQLLAGLKLLGDKSKFEIVCSLKERPKYNLEIAEQLHLTPATMSHHMNLLLSGGLVTIEKAGGKVYYRLDTEQLQKLATLFQQILLP